MRFCCEFASDLPKLGQNFSSLHQLLVNTYFGRLSFNPRNDRRPSNIYNEQHARKMADSDNGSELSEISVERFRVLEDYYEANYQEPTQSPKLGDEFDDQGFSAAEIAVAICVSRQEQDHRGAYSTIFGSSGSASREIASEVDSQNHRKRKRSQAYGDSPTRHLPPGNLTIQDRQSEEGPPGVCSEFEVTEMPEHHSARLISPTGLQSVAQDMSVTNPSLSHDL